MLTRTDKKLNWLKKTTTLFAVIFVVVFLFYPVANSLAADPVFQGPQEQTDIYGLQPVADTIALTQMDIRLVIARIIRAVLGLLGIIAICIVLYAGFIIMTSGGNEEKVTYGKRILINGVIGLIIILSAFAIVSFVINALAKIYGLNMGGRVSRTPIIRTFDGSGALGRVVKDHYPFRDQKDVARNTSIVVTFAQPISPASVIINSNNTCWRDDGSSEPLKIVGGGTGCLKVDNVAVPYYGDCFTPDGQVFNQNTDCDTLVTSSVQIYETLKGELDPIPVIEAVALASYEDGAQKNVYSLVFKPINFLGSDTTNISYTVVLSDNIMKKPIAGDDEISVFDGYLENYYEWLFETGTEFDFDPPYVERVYPSSDPNKPGYRNSVLQIYFNEPIDPTVAQGYFSSTSIFNNIVVDSSSTLDIKGEWKLSNGYTIAEFLSADECGLNSCGEIMFCLPVGCPEEDETCSESYEVLARTAELLNNPDVPFGARLFTGIYDLAGNALNGNEDTETVRTAEGQPTSTVANEIRNDDEAPDNYWWNFLIGNKKDKSAPYIEYITPSIDQGNISELALVNIRFSELMWARTVRDYVGLDEYEANHCYQIKGNDVCLKDLWFASRITVSSTSGEEKTIIDVNHREFGPNDTDLYYFPKIFSQIKDANQNCFYPGRGPGLNEDSETTECNVVYDKDGIMLSQTGCVADMPNSDATRDTGCMTTYPVSTTVGNIPECINEIKNNIVSPMSE
ncbi:MAG TPA: hypothetical protein DEB09_05745 [Candidatus Magasanikbacteria bacterium]|nr:hypothetical protein [Candidatus Magasanikbacteria bacterium]